MNRAQQVIRHRIQTLSANHGAITQQFRELIKFSLDSAGSEENIDAMRRHAEAICDQLIETVKEFKRLNGGAVNNICH